MRKKLAAAGLVVALAIGPVAARASGDSGCDARWALVAPTLDCANRIVIGPGNDTRVNLMLLLRDRAGLDGQGLADPGSTWGYDYGETFFDWGGLPIAFYPSLASDANREPAEFAGTRCQSVRTGGAQFLAAVDRNRRIGKADRDALAAGREALVGLCRSGSRFEDYEVRPTAEDLGLPGRLASPEAAEFGTYLAGAAAFYIGDWDAARTRFAELRGAKDPWVRETALYMVARSELGAANAVALDEWGFFDPDKADRPAAQRAGRAFAAYLEAYPAGRYTASAAGLVRRAEWLEGAIGTQGAAYARAVAAVNPAEPATADLLDEIDNKFLFDAGAGQAIEGPWLLAMHDLLRMRQSSEPPGIEEYDRHGLPLLTAEELARQEGAFAGQPQLYAFLKANHAFYVERDYRAVLRLLPDDARKPAYTPLQFSGQVLRGMALAELGDRNEAGFWQELIGGAKGLYQRSTVELGLALNWERSGQLANVFAAGSPIGNARIRAILLEHSAGPEILRGVVADAGRPREERDLAAYVLLYKELSRASYAAAARDLAQVRSDAPLESYSDETQQAQTPLGLFVRGGFSDGYACPVLRDTVARLAGNPRDVKGRLCLGDFLRLNGFDDSYLDFAPDKGELGSFLAYPGARIPRSRFYAEIIAEPGVAREDRAYALYRAVYCYAPSRYNTCGGEDVPEAQRQAWFRRLKGEFADTRWGREIEYYW